MGTRSFVALGACLALRIGDTVRKAAVMLDWMERRTDCFGIYSFRCRGSRMFGERFGLCYVCHCCWFLFQSGKDESRCRVWSASSSR